MKKYKPKTAKEIIEDMQKASNEVNVQPLSKEEFEKFEAMSIDDMLKLEGEERVALRNYNKYKQQLREEQIKTNEIDLQNFYEEVRATGLNTDYYKGIKEHQLTEQIIQIILKHLDMDYSQDVQEILVNKLKSRKAQGMAGSKLIQLYENADNSFRLEIAQVLETVATEKELENILSLFNNSDIDDEGKNYLPLVVAKIMGKQAIPILIKVINEKKSLDESNLFVITCVEALGKLKAVEAKELVEYYTKHKESWYRNQAKKALRKINSVKQIVPKLPKGIKYIKDNKIAYKYETSTEFDMEDVPGFLHALCNKIDADPKTLENLILDTEVEETRTYELQVKQLLRTSTLYFQIFMDDIDTPTLYFFSESKALIKSISKVIDSYLVTLE